MGSEVFYSVIIGLFGVSGILYAFFILKKDTFLKTEKLAVFKKMLPFPAIVNYCIWKLFFFLGGVLFTALAFL
jgi:hypothetical protein